MSGVITIPVNVSTSADPDDRVLLTVNGIADNTRVYQDSEDWFSEWDTTGLANGMYQLAFELDPNHDGRTTVASSKMVTVQNGLCFPDNFSVCGGSLYVHAQTIHVNGTWTIEVYGDKGEPFTSLSGPVDASGYCDYPDTSGEGIVISLLDEQGNDLPSNFYDVTITTYPAGAQQQSGGGAESRTRRYYKEKNRGQYHNWVVAYMPIFGDPTYGNPEAQYLAEMMAAAANTVYWSPYGRQNDEVVNQRNYTVGYPLEYLLEDQQDWSGLRQLLHFSEARNFVYFGHGAANLLGTGSTKITDEDLRDVILRDTTDPTSVHEHPYRFVFLDGCNTAKGQLPEIFGLPAKKKISEEKFNTKYKMFPRAFLGWSSLSITGPKSVLDQWRKNTTMDFWVRWSGLDPEGNYVQLPVGVEEASKVISAAFYNTKITLYGCPTLREAV